MTFTMKSNEKAEEKKLKMNEFNSEICVMSQQGKTIKIEQEPSNKQKNSNTIVVGGYPNPT